MPSPLLDPTKRQLTRITCSPEMTPYLREEVESLGYDIQDEDHVGIHIGATFFDCMHLSLQLRTALHVMWLLKRFRCPSPKALYTHAASFPWEALIPKDSYFSVASNVDHPSITNSMYPNLVIKDAIVDRIRKKMGSQPESGSDKSKCVISLYWKDGKAWIYLNVNGRRLADRGYRKIPVDAPMQETLAAGVLAAMGYDGSRPLVNPMCGSGTLAIEAALIAAGRAPGLLRSNFSFMHTRLFDEERWQEVRSSNRRDGRGRAFWGSSSDPHGRDACATDSRATESDPANPAPIIASDNDRRAIEAARKNAQTAGVDQLIDFQLCDFAETLLPDPPGLIILNPAYGERLSEVDALKKKYARIGDFFKSRCAGWKGYVFTGSRELSKQIGLRATNRTPFWNANIECRLLEYELYEGSRSM